MLDPTLDFVHTHTPVHTLTNLIFEDINKINISLFTDQKTILKILQSHHLGSDNQNSRLRKQRDNSNFFLSHHFSE